jgi:hypothetical protein
VSWTAEAPDAHGAALGTTLSLLGGQIGWASMAAVVQSVELRADDGTATVSFGPASHLAPQDWLELLRANRRRTATYRAGRKRDDDGQEDPATFDAVPDVARPQSVPQAGVGAVQRLQVTLPPAAALAHVIDADPSAVSGPSAAVTLKPREILCLELSGSTWTIRKRQVLCSEVYGDAVSGGNVNLPAEWELTSTNGLRYKTRPVLALGDVASSWSTAVATFDPHSGEHGD